MTDTLSVSHPAARQAHAAASDAVGRSGRAERAFLFGPTGTDPLRVMVWNTHKGKDDWRSELRSVVSDIDVAIFQEATGDMSAHVGKLAGHDDAHLSWDYATSFKYWMLGQRSTGLLTGGRAAASRVRVMRSSAREFGLTTPKLALLSEYPLAGRRDTLLVVNVHAINFVGQGSYERYLDELKAAIGSHDGPILMAGDFNGWSKDRWCAVSRLAASLGLERIQFQGAPATAFGNPLDGAFVRGLDLDKADVANQPDSSDHRPLVVQLRLSADAAATSAAA